MFWEVIERGERGKIEGGGDRFVYFLKYDIFKIKDILKIVRKAQIMKKVRKVENRI